MRKNHFFWHYLRKFNLDIVVQIPIPVRRIPISTVSITGKLDGQQFESSLERDLLMQLSWSDDVEWFVTQPVKIEYEFPPGKSRRYTPDVLFGFGSDSTAKVNAVLCEVKHRKDLAKNWQDLRPKFRAARHYCAQMGWRFAIFDEGRIRGQRLENIKFLWSFRSCDVPSELSLCLIQQLNLFGEATMSQVIQSLAVMDSEKGSLIWAWWCLVAQKRIMFNEDEPLNKKSVFYAAIKE
jgi:hypothetical protein